MEYVNKSIIIQISSLWSFQWAYICHVRSKFVDNFDNVRIYTRICRVSYVIYHANICQSPKLNTKPLPTLHTWVYLTITGFVLKLYSSWCLLRSYFSIIHSIRWVLPYGRTIYRLINDVTKVSTIQQYIIHTQHMTETESTWTYDILLYTFL